LGILAVGLLLDRLVLVSAGSSPIDTSKLSSASSRSNQREYPLAYIPTWTLISLFQVSKESFCLSIAVVQPQLTALSGALI